MDKDPDKLTLVKGRYLVQIRAKESELEELKARVKMIDQIEADARGFLSSGAASISLKGKKMVEAALETVNTIGANGGVSINDICEHMRAHGFEFKGNNYRISLTKGLKALAKKKRIVGSQDEGNRWRFKRSEIENWLK